MSYTEQELAIIDIIHSNPQLVGVAKQLKPVLSFTYKIVIDETKKPKKAPKIDIADDIKASIVAKYDEYRETKMSANDAVEKLKIEFNIEKLSAQKINSWKKA